MKVGVVGAGRIGTVHTKTLIGQPGITEVIVVDSSTDALAQLQESASTVDSGANLVISHDLDSISDGGCDALVVAAPTPMHADLIVWGVDAGMAVFCEKPIALDQVSTQRVVQLVESTGAIVQIGFQRRFDPGFIAARELLVNGELGQLYSARILTFDPAPPPPEYIAGSGGMFRDTHIHDFDSLLWVIGKPAQDVWATGSVVQHDWISDHDDVDTTAIVIRFTDGSLATINGSRSNPRGYDVRMELLGERESVSVGHGQRTPVWHMDNSEPPTAAYESFVERFADAYEAQIVAFIASVESGVQVGCTVQEARDALILADAADYSRRTGRIVSVESIASAV